MFFGDPKFAVGENGEGFEKELAGVVVQNSLKVDRFVCKELINNLYNNKEEGKKRGINIKGILVYCKENYVSNCGRITQIVIVISNY